MMSNQVTLSGFPTDPVNRQEAARILGYRDPEYVYKLYRRGKLPGYKVSGSMVMYERRDVMALAGKRGRDVEAQVPDGIDDPPDSGWENCLTKEEVAVILKVGTSTVNWLAKRWDDSNGMMGLRSYRYGRRRMYDPLDVEQYRVYLEMKRRVLDQTRKVEV